MNTQKKCSTICKTGKQCSRSAVASGDLCTFHARPATISNTSTSNRDTCSAICSNGQKCIRKCCVGIKYCGTHKPIQASDINTQDHPITTCSHSIFVEDIDGIAYYLDSHGNIFRAEDILQQSLTPRVIGTYVRRSDGRCVFAS